ncbi:uncharacterized protein LOC118179385, partial [Stegodyphus dumicola]|uniref:uncharacterized protein LOC118179385 n=1 Tax=Stegodyphus dumicola TaxID=202533 RepID=UPI0015AEBDAC
VNATKLSKDGLPRELLHFLDEPKRITIIPVLDAISEATRTRHAARQFVKEDVISRILQIIFSTSASNSNKMNSAICKIGLRILVHLTQITVLCLKTKLFMAQMQQREHQCKKVG